MANANPNTTAEPTLALTPAVLKDMIAAAVSAAVTEARKPTEVEQFELDRKKEEQAVQRAQIEADQQHRREMAQQQLVMIENKKIAQGICAHKHRKGDTHCVFVNDELGGYILCQKCQAVIRGGVEPKDNPGNVIYNNDLFNRLFQDTATNGVWE